MFWLCFVIVVIDKILKEQLDNIIWMLCMIYDVMDVFMWVEDEVILQVSICYGIIECNVVCWYYSIEWVIYGWVSNKMLKSVVYFLKVVGIIEEDQDIFELVWKRGV